MTTQASAGVILQPYRRNLILNGNFDHWPKGTSLPAAPDTTITYLPARFSYYQDSGTGVATIQQSANVPTTAQSGTQSAFSFEWEATTADASLTTNEGAYLLYNVEGYDIQHFMSKDITLSFWVRATKTGTHCISFRNSGKDRSYVVEYAIAASDTWQKVMVTVPLTELGGTWDFTTGRGLTINFVICQSTAATITTGTTDTWLTGNFTATGNQVNGFDTIGNKFAIAQVQLETGAIATPLEYTNFADEASKIKRYIERLTSPTGFTRYGSGFQTATTASSVYVPFNTAKRAQPTIVVSAAANFAIYNGAVVACTSVVSANPGLHGTGLNLGHGVTGAAGDGVVFLDNNLTSAWLQADAEIY